MSDRQPAEAFHPGEFLREWMDSYARDRLNREINNEAIDLILDGSVSIDDLIATQLSHVTDTSKNLWLNLQRQYDEWKEAQHD